MKGILIVVVVVLVALGAALAVVSVQNRGLISRLTQGRVAATGQAASTGQASSRGASPTVAPTLAAPQSLLDVSGSGSKITSNFTVAQAWDLAWSYDCSAMGQSRNFGVTVENGAGIPPTDSLQPVIQLGLKEQGTVREQPGGTFHLNVGTDTPCTWHVAVTGSPGPPPASPTGKTLLDVSGSGNNTTQTFSAAGAWDIAWSFDCSSMHQGRDFFVSPQGVGATSDAGGNGVITSGEQEAGLANYKGGGTFQLKVATDPPCTWHLVVSG
jgi:hypothetical protein